MAFQKKFADGSTYDGINGYRTPEQVAKDEEAGIDRTPRMPEHEKENLWKGALAALIFIAMVLSAILASTLYSNAEKNREAIKVGIENSAAFDSNFGKGSKAHVLELERDYALLNVRGSVISCDVEYSDAEMREAHVFCGSPIALLTVQLPR